MGKPDITAERLRDLLSYDPLTGLFTRLVNRRGTAKAGDVAGTDDGHGYLLIGVDGKPYMVHRLAWVWMTGEFPENEIRHVNGVRTDNRWSNLCEVSRQQNVMRREKQSNNSSGFKGVHRNGNRWQAKIKLDGKTYFLGTFDKPEEASLWYEGAAAILFGDWKRITVETTTKVTYER